MGCHQLRAHPGGAIRGGHETQHAGDTVSRPDYTSGSMCRTTELTSRPYAYPHAHSGHRTGQLSRSDARAVVYHPELSGATTLGLARSATLSSPLRSMPRRGRQGRPPQRTQLWRSGLYAGRESGLLLYHRHRRSRPDALVQGYTDLGRALGRGILRVALFHQRRNHRSRQRPVRDKLR